ncbi:hypothetical protein CQ10_05270 [Bradyrhizobium valentinum]|uniref:Uncharacterized protein n=1 Tax=Bradyrhizobium valentinum TaxID=1518501 RepID=A0A0R3KE48_9BRAD|nr:hypothetical protein CP49_32130 [Bradyrhizobium valentinum]KRQ97242.1 hypothetical protein CQ10_05270 [Bradyrhizobium valentinum]
MRADPPPPGEGEEQGPRHELHMRRVADVEVAAFCNAATAPLSLSQAATQRRRAAHMIGEKIWQDLWGR